MTPYFYISVVSCALIFIGINCIPMPPQEQFVANKMQISNQGASNQQPNTVQQNNGNNEPLIAAASSYDSGYGGNYESYDYGFDCYGKRPALYGDANYDCKIYHVCQADGRSDTFKCPKWTRFNNYLGICDWHFKVDSYCNPLDYNSYNSGSGNSYSGNSANHGNSY